MFAQVQTALEEYFKDNWSATSIDWENTSFESKTLSEFVRFSIQYGQAERRGIGDRPCLRTPGVIFVQIFVRPGSGNARLMELASAAANLFKSIIVADVTIMDGPSLTKSPGEEAGWVQALVSINFYFDEVI